MEFMYGWFATPLTFVAGSSPEGHAPAKPSSSRTVISPPRFGGGASSTPPVPPWSSSPPPQADSINASNAISNRTTGLPRCITETPPVPPGLARSGQPCPAGCHAWPHSCIAHARALASHCVHHLLTTSAEKPSRPGGGPASGLAARGRGPPADAYRGQPRLADHAAPQAGAVGGGIKGAHRDVHERIQPVAGGTARRPVNR